MYHLIHNVYIQQFTTQFSFETYCNQFVMCHGSAMALLSSPFSSPSCVSMGWGRGLYLPHLSQLLTWCQSSHQQPSTNNLAFHPLIARLFHQLSGNSLGLIVMIY